MWFGGKGRNEGGRQLEQLEYRIWKEEYSFVFRIKSIESNQDKNLTKALTIFFQVASLDPEQLCPVSSEGQQKEFLMQVRQK